MARNQSVELRDESGLRFGRFLPDAEPICPWEHELTKEEVELRCAQPTKTRAEVFQKLENMECNNPVIIASSK